MDDFMVKCLFDSRVIGAIRSVTSTIEYSTSQAISASIDRLRDRRATRANTA